MKKIWEESPIAAVLLALAPVVFAILWALYGLEMAWFLPLLMCVVALSLLGGAADSRRRQSMEDLDEARHRLLSAKLDRLISLNTITVQGIIAIEADLGIITPSHAAEMMAKLKGEPAREKEGLN